MIISKKVRRESDSKEYYLLRLYHERGDKSMQSQLTYDLLKKQIAEELFDEFKKLIQEKDLANRWVNQTALVNEYGYSWQTIKRMESYGLKSFKNGKDKMYCLADVNEIKHLMKQ